MWAELVERYFAVWPQVAIWCKYRDGADIQFMGGLADWLFTITGEVAKMEEREGMAR